MIYLNSRYADALVAGVVDARTAGNDTAVYRKFPGTTAKSYLTYTWVEGDRLDIVAAQHYSDPTQYWRILDDNPAILDPLHIKPGTSIRIANG